MIEEYECLCGLFYVLTSNTRLLFPRAKGFYRVRQRRLTFLCWVVHNKARSGEVFQGHRYVQHAREFGWNTHATIWFQQDGAISHTAWMSIEKLCEILPHRLTVSWFELAAKISLLLSPWLFFVGISEELRIRDAACHFGWTQGQYLRSDSWLLERVMDDSTKRLQECSTAVLGGGDFLNSVFIRLWSSIHTATHLCTCSTSCRDKKSKFLLSEFGSIRACSFVR
jgi:hypothetical protein